jgi:hypothetical protein
MTREQFITSLIARAASHIGEGEAAPNRGDFIDEANRFTQVPLGSPYCVSALLLIAHQVAEDYGFFVRVPRIAGAVRLYDQGQLFRLDKPEPGCIMIWQRDNEGTKGHAALVTEVLPNSQMVRTIEFNTNSLDASVTREGDGCYSKVRSIHGTQKMRVLGWLRIV